MTLLKKLLITLGGLTFALQISLPLHAEEITTLDNIVAIVNNDVVTQLELKDQFREIVITLKSKNTKLPPADILGKQVLDKLILERIQLDLASRTGIKVDDTTLNRAVTRIAAQNNMSISEFRAALAEQDVDYRKFSDEIKKQIILKRLIQRNVVNKITISDQEIDNFLFNVEKQGGLEQSYHLAHILIETPEDATPEQIKVSKIKAEKLVRELRSGRDFAAAALAMSKGQNALEGGDLGWRKSGELPSLFSETTRKLSIGEISEPIRSSSGFHIIKLLDSKGGEQNIITQTQARHILIKPDIVSNDEQVKIRLNQIRSRIINGEDFATMAKAYSEDKTSATRGGNLGWFKPGTMVPAFEKAVDELQPGEISDIVQTEFGYHIIEVLGRRSHDDSDEMIRNKVRELLTQRKIAEDTENFYRRIRDEAYVEIRLDNK
jgi:peptidyl-prolyl cis-trans isomerase SurA